MNHGLSPIPQDFSAVIENNQNNDTGFISEGLYPGNSGSPVYRLVAPSRPESEIAANIQLVGVFSGALQQNPNIGCFYYGKTLTSILASEKDCFDESGLEFADWY